MQIKTDVWSNIFFIIPFIIALYNNLYIHSIIIALVFISSIIYHITKDHSFADKVFAQLLMAYNLYLCYLVKFKSIYFWFALIFAIIGFYFFFVKNKDDWEWHTSCAIITTFCLLAFISIDF